MGAVAEGFVAYAQPLLDQTDGSEEQLNKALAITQLCFNPALVSEDKRDAALSEMRSDLQMEDAEFDDFLSSVIMPMIRRHQEMFPRMHGLAYGSSSQTVFPPLAQPKAVASNEAYPGTDRYAPCPCNSGEKYKFCCGKKRR